MPTYNASTWIREAIDSALAQTWTDFELVVSDNASTDSTLEIVRSYDDPRIRLEPSERNLGVTLNHNRVVKLSTGRYVKFLHGDDTLAPTCIEEMMALALEDDRIGLVFSPRENVIFDERGAEWARVTTRDHESLGPPERVNDGRVLFLSLLVDEFIHNWIGEPSAVLLSREALATCGLFNRFLRQTVDFELWLRVLLHYRVGFVEAPMCTFRMHQGSVSAYNRTADDDWLDRLWLLEGLIDDDGLGPFRAMVSRLRHDALRAAKRRQVRRFARGRFAPSLSTYFRFRSLPPERRSAVLHERLG
jgi:glycosyltransferase involved in cell wall biosynthesis